ncbi:Hpt domain-containing protein [Shimia haliotis]|uniref:Hpt domain-containing protein n=1 Tax=Shimia haliotis TaxID=1280847 RepID=A0A1I4GW46_9RHOB|nr:Hpt domain-containing protein [Shimia haliotis]SFL34185.1 Hpt domain-containing protein [Shimia haliotis]
MFPLEHQDKFAKLRAHFVQTLPAREAEIEELVTALMEHGPSRKVYENLFIATHKLAGISATYGMAALGSRAEQAEALIDSARKNRPDEEQFYAILAATDVLTEEIRRIAEID